MLFDFITIHRQEVLDRARSRVERRLAPIATPTEITNGIPLFLDQLIESLRLRHEDGGAITYSAGRHGHDLHRLGYTVTQVVYGYGDICQAVTQLTEEYHTLISTEEFQLLNKCLDDAIAGAVTAFTNLRQTSYEDQRTAQLAALGHELRNKVNAATLAYAAIKSGAVGVAGSTGAILDRNLRAMGDLINGSLAAVRIETGIQHREAIRVFELVEEIEAEGVLEATDRGLGFSVAPVSHDVYVSADRAVLGAAVINLLHNAFKFSHPQGRVALQVTADMDRVFLSVQDQCGGLPAGKSEELFRPFTQRGGNRTGVGLGLSIARKGVEADGGTLTVEDLPGVGCIFTIGLPRMLSLTA